MEHSHAKTSHYFLRAIILLGFAMLIVYLVKTDSLIFYIAPHMQKYVEYSSVLLYVIAIYQVYLGINSIWGKKSASSCGCEHPPSKSSIKNTIAYSLFILPLCLGFLLPSTAMSSSLADKKGMNLTTSVAAKNITKQLAASTVSLATVFNKRLQVHYLYQRQYQQLSLHPLRNLIYQNLNPVSPKIKLLNLKLQPQQRLLTSSYRKCLKHLMNFRKTSLKWE